MNSSLLLKQSNITTSVFYACRIIPHSGYYYIGKYIMDDFGTLIPLENKKLEIVMY